eukprot:5848551-Ditylum_brightwellii.AAC.1
MQYGPNFLVSMRNGVMRYVVAALRIIMLHGMVVMIRNAMSFTERYGYALCCYGVTHQSCYTLWQVPPSDSNF